MTNFTFAGPLAKALEICQPYVVAPKSHWESLDLSPMGLQVRPKLRIDPTLLSSEGFITWIERLDAQTFGPQAMAMPRWVFYDCSEWPSCLFGLAVRPEFISPMLREVYGVASKDKVWVPLTLHVAIPTVVRGEFFEHNVGSLGHELGIHGLGTFTKALGCKVLRAENLVGAAQWTGKALGMHLRFGPLQLLTAYTPAHSYARTMTYRHSTDDETLARVLRGEEAPVFKDSKTINVDDRSLQRLQRKIEQQKRKYFLATRTVETKDGLCAGIHEEPA